MAEISPIDIQKALGGVDYPASKDDLVSHAESSGASSDVLEALRSLPDRNYDGPTGVNAELG